MDSRVITRHKAALACGLLALFVVAQTAYAQTATWIGPTGGDWNAPANWDIGVPGLGTNAAIPTAQPVNYSSAMLAPSFRTLALSNTLSITASGFVIDEQGASSTVLTVASNANLNIGPNVGVTVTNSAGSINIPNGGALNLGGNGFFVVGNSSGGSISVGNSGNPTKGGAITINSGATMTVDKMLNISGVPSFVFVNGGTLNCIGGSGINESQNDGSQKFAIGSGTVNLGDFSVTRCNNTTAGLMLTNGVVNATSIRIGTGNSIASSSVFGGILTNSGAFNISDTPNITATSGDRKSYFNLKGGTVVSTASDGIVVASQSNTSSSPSASGSVLGGVLNVTGGTLIAEKLTLIRDNTIVNAYASFTMSGGTVYLGSGGLVMNAGASHIGRNLALTGGTLGAKASWSSTAPISINNTVTFRAADSANTPFDIALTGVITNTGSLAKTGGGTLTISGNNTYSGATTVSAGTLAIGGANALPKGTGLTLGSSGNTATVDLAGFNAQISNLALGSGASTAGQLITNSSAANASTITFSNTATSTFGGIIAGGAKPIALTILGGGLTLSGQNVYGGNLIVSGSALTLSGAGSTFTGSSIVLSNSAVLDASGMGGFSLGAGQSLEGTGSVGGNVAAANCPVTPSTLGVAGTLAFNNNLAFNGGVTSHFDLALDPTSPNNDLITVAGTFSASGMNTIDVAPLGASLSAGNYKLITFGSLGSGSAANFQITGTLGASLQASIAVTSTEVDLVVLPAGGTQRIWVGDGSLNNWDYSTANWLNGASPDDFSDATFAIFDDTGSKTPPVNLTTTLQPAGVVVNAAANYTFSGPGKISGTGTLTKTNSGTLVLLTANNYSGVTLLNQGILQLGNGTTSGSIGTNIVQNSSALVLDLPGNNTFANTVTGAGELVQAGPGTLTLTASNSYSGGTVISSGTLQLNTGASFGSGNVTNNSSLIFNGSGNTTISSIISGSGSVNLNGGGTVTLTGNNTYSGGTTISAGTLLVNTSASSGVGSGPVAVNGGGSLSGNGVIGGAVTVNSGGISTPGNPIGTLTVSNNFTANSGAILNYSLGTTSDRTIVYGNLNLSGTLNVTGAAGFTSGTYTLFNYSGALTLGSLTLSLPANTSATVDTNTAGQVNLIVSTLQTNIASFPGALGFGGNATGARIGGSVYHVTTLADSGPGSFRDAVSHSGRTIVFDVGGTIQLASVVACQNNLTIAGQTAPGDGIAIIGHEVSFSARQNEIVRYLRIRPGSMQASGEDAINVGDGTNMVFDHMSFEFAGYNNIDAHGNAGSDAITVQNSIIGDPMSNGTAAKQGFGAHTEHIGGKMAWYYNIWVSEHNRQPMAKIDTIFVNNVEYNFQAGYTVANTSGHFRHDIINNYFITGPTDPSGGNAFYQMNANQTIYSTGNLRDNNNDGSLNGSSISPGGGGTVLGAPWSPLSTNTTVYSTAAAYHYGVSLAGAVPYDQLDSLIISQIKTLGHGTTGTGPGTAGPGGGLYFDQTSTGLGNNGYGVLNGGIAPLDSDQDGMPDYWEQAMGSNPNVADSLVPGFGGYSRLENYLNWLGAPHAAASKNSFVDVDLRLYTGGFTNFSPAYAVFAPTNGTVTILPDGHTAEFTAAGGFSGLGSFNFSVQANDGATVTNTVGILVATTTLSQNLTWHGDGTANNWDTTSSNWVDGATPSAFSTGDDVAFDDSGANTPAINLVGALQPDSVTVAANQNYTFSGSGSLNGSMVLAKSGTGTLTIATSNSYSGGTFVNGGTIALGSIDADGHGLGSNTVTLNDGTRLNLYDGGPVLPRGNVFPNNISVNGNATLEMFEQGSASGKLTGQGTFNLIAHNVAGDFNGDSSAFTGDFNASTPDAGGADFRIGSYAGFPNASVNFSTNINAYFSAGSLSDETVDFGELNAAPSAKFAGGPTAGRSVALRIGALGTDSDVEGSIGDRVGGAMTSLIKIGTGALTLGGANTYSGTTVVSNGTLIVNGSTGTNALMIVNGTLSGAGSIGGSVALASGNTVSPGANPNPGAVGTLTISNGLTLNSAKLDFDFANVTTPGGGVNDLLQLRGGVLTLSGTSVVIPNLINGFLAPGAYTLITGGNSTVGSPANLAWGGAAGTRQSFSFDTTTPGTVLLDVVGPPPANLVWSGTNGSTWDLNNTVNWINAGAADKFFDLDSVVFNDTSTNGNVLISGTVHPAQVTVVNSTLNYNLGGGVLGGAGAIVKSGSGSLILSGSNSFTGGTFLNGGTIVLANDTANQFALGSGTVTLSAGALTMFDDTNAALAVSWNMMVQTSAIGTLNTPSRVNLNGSLLGGGTFNFNVPSTNVILNGDWSAFFGTINVASSGAGDFRVNNLLGYPNAFIALSNNVRAEFNGAVDPDGTTLQIGALSGVSSSTLLGGSTSGNAFTWQIGSQNTDATFAGTIREQTPSSMTAIEKIGTGTWTLSGSNTFVGGMTVSEGTLRVNNTNGSAVGTNQIFVAGGATLTGNGIIGAPTAFDDAAIFSPGNNGFGTLTISNDLDLSDQTVLQFSVGYLFNQVVVSGDLTLGGLLNITSGGGFGVGTYKLFTYRGTLTMGNLTVASAPPGFDYSISTNTPGEVDLVVSHPQFNGAKLGSNGFVMSGSGGPANGTYYILSSTNIAIPLNLWAPIATNQFDASGNFNFTNGIGANTSKNFYILQLP